AALTGHLAEHKGVRTVLVTSAERGDGRTVTAANLAAAARLSGKRVALVSTDFADTGLQRVLGVNGQRSLGDVLTGSMTTLDALQDVDGLKVLTSKTTGQTQGLLLRVDRMARVLADLRDSADLVVIDAPPIDASDALAVAPLSDGVLFVARSDKTTPDAVERARGRLGMLGVKVIGGVVT